tara:strand:+ start:874 stop:1176 length:303 start_codon:yes stop_codon:yes gene_type:complete
MAEKVQNRKATRSVGSRLNPFSEDATKRDGADLEKTINQIAEKVDSAIGTVEKQGDAGTSGSMRFVKDKKDWYLEVKTEDGWIRSSNSSISGFILRDKAS